MRKLRVMTDSPETEGTGRARFKYLSDDKSPVSLPGNADATPSVIRGGDVVEVNAEAAELLADDPMFELTDEPYTVQLNAREQREADAVEAAAAEAEGLKGESLNDALRERDLPLTGTASEKRARIAEFDAAGTNENANGGEPA